VFAILPELSADEWTAIATWLAVALATFGGFVARGQLVEARGLRIEQAQPYVVVYTESSPAGPWVLDLVVKNFGATAATNVRMEFDPPLQRAAHEGEDVILPESIPVLVPQQQWRTLWDTGIARAESDLPDRHVATVRFADSQGREMRSYSFVLDWAPLKVQDVVTVYGSHHAAVALRELSAEAKKWREGPTGGLKVYTRDGDARDKRMREDADERRAARRQRSQAPDDGSLES
jgi:hypothetical protein